VTTVEKMARELSPMSWAALNTKCDTKAKAKRRAASIEFARKCICAMRDPHPRLLSVLHDTVFRVGPEKAWDLALDMLLEE